MLAARRMSRSRASARRRVAEHIDEVQEVIRRPLLLENPSTYVLFTESTMSETAFIREIVKRTGCGLLLDVNNVFVSATNHGFSPLEYLSDYPLEHAGEIHLAGHTEQEDDEGDRLLIDSHDGPVADAVWKLFDIVISRRGPIPTLIEWDSAIPDWPVLKAEARRRSRSSIGTRLSDWSGSMHAPRDYHIEAANGLDYPAGFVPGLLDPAHATPALVADPSRTARSQMRGVWLGARRPPQAPLPRERLRPRVQNRTINDGSVASRLDPKSRHSAPPLDSPLPGENTSLEAWDHPC